MILDAGSESVYDATIRSYGPKPRRARQPRDAEVVMGEARIGGLMFQPNQRVTVDLSGLVIQGVSFSQNVQKALGTILQQVSTDPPVYKVELLFSFKGVKRVDVPEERIHGT
jgi:hypothetical protein